MSDHTFREESDSDSEVGSSGPDAEGPFGAVGDVWHVWLIGAAAVLVAVYFHYNEGVWTTAAESFYALIFAGAALFALGYGVYGVRERTSPV